ncbi:hypothetical protein [Spirosoma fluminis]
MPRKRTMKRGKHYEIVGLQEADRMPIRFAGREFDLANLSAEDAYFLLQHPEQVPYLKKLDVSPAPV